MQTRASGILVKDSELAIAMKISMKDSESTAQLRSKGKVGENLGRIWRQVLRNDRFREERDGQIRKIKIIRSSKSKV